MITVFPGACCSDLIPADHGLQSLACQLLAETLSRLPIVDPLASGVLALPDWTASILNPKLKLACNRGHVRRHTSSSQGDKAMQQVQHNGYRVKFQDRIEESSMQLKINSLLLHLA